MNLSLKTRISLAIINTSISLWAAMFIIMEWGDYEWNWSNNKALLSLQYLANGFWFIGGILMFVWAAVGSVFIITNGFKE